MLFKSVLFAAGKRVIVFVCPAGQTRSDGTLTTCTDVKKGMRKWAADMAALPTVVGVVPDGETFVNFEITVVVDAVADFFPVIAERTRVFATGCGFQVDIPMVRGAVGVIAGGVDADSLHSRVIHLAGVAAAIAVNCVGSDVYTFSHTESKVCTIKYTPAAFAELLVDALSIAFTTIVVVGQDIVLASVGIGLVAVTPSDCALNDGTLPTRTLGCGRIV